MNPLLSSTFSFSTIMQLALCIMMTGILILVSLFNPCGAEAAEDTFYVEVLVARIRQAPTTESPILFKARRGDPMVVEKNRVIGIMLSTLTAEQDGLTNSCSPPRHRTVRKQLGRIITSNPSA